MNRLDKRSRLLLERLQSGKGYVVSADLAAAAGVTTRTVKSDLKKISQVLQDYGASVSSKSGSGYKILVHDPDAYAELEGKLRFESREQYKRIPQTKLQRINYIIMKLLSVDYCMNLDDLAEELYVEKSTVTSYVKDIRTILCKYKLSLRNDPRNGIIIEGSEIHKRICISEYFFHNHREESLHAEDNIMFSNPVSKSEIRRIRDILLRVMRQYGLQLSGFSVENIAIHIMVALRRWTLFDYVSIKEAVADRVKGTVEEAAGRQLVRELEEAFGILLPESEAIYFALHIRSKMINTTARLWSNQQENEKLSDTIVEIFDEIQRYYGLDLHGDTTITNYLFAHIRTMLERLEIGFPLRNAQAYEHMREFLLATRLAHLAVKVVEKNYRICIDANEESFLVLYFNLAICRMNMKQGLRIAVTNGSGRPEGIILLNKIAQARKGIPDNITFFDMTELENISEKDYDIIISPTELHPRQHIPVLHIGIGTEFDTERLQKIIDLACLGDLNYDRIFPEKNLFLSVGGNDRKSVFSEMEKQLAALGEEEDAGILRASSLVEMEKGCAVLFANRQVSDCFLRVFCLKKPVLMDKMPVQTIFWADAPREHCNTLSVLLDILSQWLRSDPCINEFRQNMTRSVLVEQLECLRTNL